MLLSKECDYAIRIMRALAGGELVSVQQICRQEGMTVSMAYKLARKLEKTGYIRSYRGSNGGYSLNVSLKEVTLYDICKAIDKDLLVCKCISCGYACEKNTEASPCLVHRELCRIQGILNRELRSKSLSEILSQSP